MREVGVAELHRMRSAGEPVLVLDVRQPEEVAVATLPGAMVVPMGELPARLEAVRASRPAGSPLVVMCHHGVRSRMAALYLASAGFDGVASLAGGIDAWSREIDPTIPRY